MRKPKVPEFSVENDPDAPLDLVEEENTPRMDMAFEDDEFAGDFS